MKNEPGRIYHPYTQWEEVKHNMWGKVGNREEYLQRAIKFTGNTELYGSFMERVVNEWPYSCEYNLGFKGHNRRAWLGHAACALAFQCPEDVVREAWGKLSTYQQIKANEAADKAIARWERKPRKAAINDKQMGLFDAENIS